MAEQDELFPPDHRTLTPKRLKNYGRVNPEAIYLTEWRKRMKERPDLLGRILAPDNGPKDWTESPMPVIVSPRDARLIATFVQWLGTAVGSSFISECQRKVAAAFDQQTKIGIKRARRKYVDPRTPLERAKARVAESRKRIGEAAGSTP